jgi:hypothetical protein
MQKRSRARIAALSLIAAVLSLASYSNPIRAQGGGAPALLTQHNDNTRSGANLNETVLNTSNVNVNQFGKLFSRFVDGQVFAQPLYLSGVAFGQTVRNVVYVATMKNNVYAFDADGATSTPLWQVNLGPGVPVEDVGEVGDIYPLVGVTSTPVIDAASGTLYCVAKTKEGTSYFQRLHALDIATGQEKLGGPVVIEASVPGTGDDSVGGMIGFNARRHLNRPALLLSDGYLYLAFGSHGDQRLYHGWVLSYDAATLQKVASFNVTPSGWGGGIWSSGQGLSADDNGYIYFMTGNGSFNMNAGGQNCSSCFMKLGTPSLNLIDWFAPYNQNDLNVNDFDLNSSGPLLLPGFNRLVGGGKSGILYVLDRGKMGHFQAGSNSQIVQNLQITYGDHLHGAPIYWDSPEHGPLVYVWYEESYLKAFKIVNGLFENIIDPNTGLLVPVTKSSMKVPPGMPGGVLSLSANGSTAGSGVVWATTPYNADAHFNIVAGIFRAFDASNLSVELWNSKQNAARDDAGNFAKFTPPTIANGKVYVATFSNQLVVYGLLNDAAPAPAVNSVAPSTGPTTGGTAVTITGTGFAPGATVSVGGSAATGVNVVNSTTITATTPAHAAGVVSVTVTNPDAQIGTLASGFTYTAPPAPAPTVDSVAPSAGPTTGGTVLAITGTGFAAGATVTVGGSAATGVSVVNSTTLNATTPPHAAGVVNVTVTNTDAQSGTRVGGFTYTASTAGPTVSSVAPASGPTTGGTAVTITGTNFVANAAITADVFIDMNVADAVGTTLSRTIMANGTIGAYSGSWTGSPEPPTGFSVGPHLHDRNAPVQIGSATYPPSYASKSMALDHAYSSRTETVSMPAGRRAVTIAGFITFGPANAGTSSKLFDYWVIQGGATGDFAALQLNNGRGGAGYGVTIETNPGGVTTRSPYITITPGATYWCVLKGDFTTGIARLAVYEIANWSLVGSVTSSQSAGGENVGWIKIGNSEYGTAPGTTSYFENIVIDYTAAAFPLGPGSSGNTSVTLGGVAATNVNVTSATTLTATTPPNAAGPVSVTVTSADALSGSLLDGFTYTLPAPTVTNVSPSSGPIGGGTPVTITGTNFAAGATVSMGGSAATAVIVVNATTITATTAAHAAGTVSVTVTNSDGQSGTRASGFTYLGPAPTVGSVTPASGPTTGGTAVTIAGTNFASGATVTLGGNAATGVSVVNSTTINAITPAHAAGAVNVTVTNGDAQSASLSGGFTYIASTPAPTVASVSPSSGPTTGGTAVTITGTNFASGATVSLGGSAATGVNVVTSTTITATTPAHASGPVSITVTNTDGQGGTLSSGFTYTSVSQPIALVQHTGKDAGTTQSTTLTFATSTTAHNWIAVVIRAGRSGQAFTITDTRGNVYRRAVQLNETVDGTTVAIFYAEDIAGGTNTVTVSDSISGGTLRLAMFEYSGVATANALDVVASAQGTSTTPTSGFATTTASDELVIGGISSAESATFTAGSGYVIQERVPATAPKLVVEDRRQTAAGPVSASATLSVTRTWGAVMATFKRAP